MSTPVVGNRRLAILSETPAHASTLRLCLGSYLLVIRYSLLLNMAIEIVDIPIQKMVDCNHSKL